MLSFSEAVCDYILEWLEDQWMFCQLDYCLRPVPQRNNNQRNRVRLDEHEFVL